MSLPIMFLAMLAMPAMGGTACVSSHVDSRRTGTDGSSHPAADRTRKTARDGDDDKHKRKRKPRTASAEPDTPGQRVRAGVVTRVIGKPDKFDEDPTKYADWSLKLRSHSGAVDQQYQEELNTEAASTTRLHASLDGEESAPSTQMYYALVATTAGAAMN